MIRRRFLAACASFALYGCAGSSVRGGGLSGCPAAVRAAWVTERLRALEEAAAGRLGVHVLDTASGAEYGYRADERFLMLSTFKLLASALALARTDAGLEDLDRRVAYSRQDLVEWSPVTEKHADDGRGLSLAQLCAAALTTSDNTAANLILASFGGPAALTAFARRIGDPVTRLDRNEPELNLLHGDAWDTTTPRAMARSVRAVVLDSVLSAASRARLQGWLRANTTGEKRLKAGLPADWRIAEKTGSNRNSANDIGVLWPPGRAPFVVAAYLADSRASGEVREATLAAVGRLVADLAECGSESTSGRPGGA
jgi:beta-lactamase class A